MLRFTKMHGLGNDFVLIDCITQVVSIGLEQIRYLADRHFGIGCDQVLLAKVSDRPEADFRYSIFNADGSEAEQCGNGARCFASFVRNHGLIDRDTIRVITAGGLLELHIKQNGQVTVDMGQPKLEPADIPFLADKISEGYTVSVDGTYMEVSVVSMGNPHAILIVDDVNRVQVAKLGPLLEQHSYFPKRTNVGFMQVVTPDHIRLRVFERGVGETMACGSGACAAVVAGRLRGILQPEVSVELVGGELDIHWVGEGNPVTMTGPVTTVFEGKIEKIGW